MRLRRIVVWLSAAALVAAIVGTAYGLRDRIRPWIAERFAPASHDAEDGREPAAPTRKARILELSRQARENLGLVAKPARTETYWRTVTIPGEIVDRPGLSDRAVTSPVVGNVAEIRARPGDTVHAGDVLFTLRLVSEYLQNAQAELFKAVREDALLQEQYARLEGIAKTGAVPEARLLEIDNQRRRQAAAIRAGRQDLLTRGLNPEQIRQVEGGNFVATVDVVVPVPARPLAVDVRPSQGEDPQAVRLVSEDRSDLAYEVQELVVEPGQQVQAGQLLARLSNHRLLYVEGHAFKHEAPYLERTARERRPLELEFAEDEPGGWPTLDQTFEIRHMSNTIDPESRTFGFYVPLVNQSRAYARDGATFLIWRFRPGQRVRLHVPVERFDGVFVLPAEAVVREGPEAYVFRQNGDLFDRRPVHVLHEDRRKAVIAADGSVTPGMYLAQGSAASLNRVLQAQAAGGKQPGLHVHADGTVHAAH